VEDIQVQRRQDRARAAQFGIRNLGDEPVFSRFAVESSSSGRTYEVTIRSLSERANSCTCPDFLTNLVGTCKHVEAVLISVKDAADSGLGPVRPQVYLHHGEELSVRLLFTPNPLAGGPAVLALLDRYFRRDGTFRGDLAQEFEGFREAAERSGFVDIAPEVVALVADLRELALLGAERDRWLERLARGERLAVTELPLYPYQERGALHLAYGRRALLADELGLGKTVQAIAAAELLRREGRVKRTLIVCPESVRHQWQKEIFRFTGQEAFVADGPAAQRTQGYGRALPYVLVGYEHVVRDQKELAALAPDLIVLDEAQRIRNWRSKTADAVKRLTSPFAFVLTGTPLENRLDDLYSVMQFLDQRLLGPLWRFNQRYYVLDGASREAKVVGYKNLDDLRARLSRVLLRRRREDVAAELPERVQNTFEVGMLEPQRKPYDEARSAIARVLGRGRAPTAAEREQITRHLARMRMACDAAELVGAESPETPPKLAELERILTDVLEDPAAKVVVSTEWEKAVQLVGRMLDALAPGWLSITGRVPVEKRRALLEKFRRDDGARVLVTTDVVGLTIEVDGPCYVVNLDVPWSPTRLEQRIARVATTGRARTVNVVNLVTAGAIEEAILILQGQKRALHDEGVESDVALDRMPIPTLSGQLDLEMLRALVTPEPVAAILESVPGGEAAAVLAEFTRVLDGPGAGLAALFAKVDEVAAPAPKPAAPRVAAAHPGRDPSALPADPLERQQAVRRVFAEALGQAFRDIAPLGAGYVVQLSRVDQRSSVQVAGIAARLGVPAVALDADGLVSLRALVAPLVAGAERSPAAQPDEAQDEAAVRRDRARVRLSEARVLLTGGMGPAALKAAREAMELTVEALCLTHTGRCPPPAELVGELYGRLVRDGLVPLDLAAGVSRARDLAGVAEGRGRGLVDVTVARAVVHDADALLKLADSSR
jgi:superfamily II DNA or RNA helicase